MFRLVVQRPIAVAMISLAAALFGLLSLQQRPMSLMPPLSFPTLTILTEYQGAAPEEVETELTDPIEERLGTIEGLRALRSTSKAGLSEVKLELAWGADLNYTLQRVYERLDRLKLPEGIDPPQVLRYDPTLEPLMVVALTQTGRQELSELRRYAEDSLSPALYQLEGVAAVKVTGGAQARVEVELLPEALARYKLTPQLVAERLRAAHVNLAGGQLRTDNGEVLVRTLAQIHDLEALGELLVHQEGGAWVKLKDIATLQMGTEERRSWVQVGLDQAVRVQIYRQADANLVELARALRTKLFKEAERSDSALTGPLSLALPHPKGVSAHLVQDQARFIERALSAVGLAIWSGGLLAVIILYLFLRSAYQTLVVALSIPLSVILSFIPLHAFGVSLNLMSLGGLALGVGMLVDNAVVVLESIAKERERGRTAHEAAIVGAAEVGSAVLASTLTTVAVFLPVAFIEGIAGQVFRDLALTVVSALIASLAVALGVVPTLAARDPSARAAPTPLDDPEGQRFARLLPLRQLPELWGRRRQLGTWRWALGLPLTLPLAGLETLIFLCGNLLLIGLALSLGLLSLPWRALLWIVGGPMRGLSYLVGLNVSWLERSYSLLLSRSLHRPSLPIFAALGCAYLAWGLVDEIPRSLLPEVSQGALIAELSYPVGTSLEDTRARAQRWIERLNERADEVQRVELLIGQDESDQQAGGERGPHEARLTISLRRRGQEEPLSERLRSWALNEPGAELKVSRPSLLTLRPPLRVALRGRHLSALKEAEARVYQALSALEGLSDLERSMGQGYPELRVRYDSARLSFLGLSPLEVAQQLRAQLTGVEALELRWDSVMTPIVVRVEGAEQLSEDKLPSLMVMSGAAGALPLASIAGLISGQGPAEIRHLDGQRAAEVSAYASAFELGRRADELNEALASLSLPAGVELSLAGQESEMSESATQLSLTLLLSLFLVFVVMATQFESVRAPLLIMGSVPLAAIGVLVGLWWTQTPLSVVVFVGMITLSGVVVNNAIVYVDAAQRAAARGLAATEALIEAGRARLRPILMTTLTTLIGLLPMLSPEGEGAELRAPLALTLIFGLGVSTLLILFVLPALSKALAPPRGLGALEPELASEELSP